MNYGKMAYLRLDELEQRLTSSSRQERKYKSMYSLSQPQKEIRDERGYLIANITGTDAMSLIVKVTLDVRAVGSLKLLVGGFIASENRLENEGKAYELFVQSVLTKDEAGIELKADDGLVADVLSVEVVLSGINADIIKSADIVRLDNLDDKLALVKATDERLEFLDSLDGEGGIGFGFGAACDVVILGDGDYRLVYCDSFGNTWGLRLSRDSELERICLTKSDRSLALTHFDGKLIVGFVDKNGAGYFVTDTDFGAMSQKVYFDLPQKASSVLFVKNAVVPTLVFNCGQKSFLKTAQTSDGQEKSTVKAQIFVEVE